MTPSTDVATVVEVRPGDGRFDAVMGLAASILNQDRCLAQAFPHAVQSHILGAFHDAVPMDSYDFSFR